MTPIARYLKTHTSSDTSTNYTPAFTDGSGFGSATGSVGTWTPNYFGVHNPAAFAQDVTIWTVDQGTSGSGALVHIAEGATFYARIAKIEVVSDVVLLGTTNTPGVV
jgi:hypothetical protein